ncbi:N-acetylmuramoyl-L-alanine amidase [Clostridium sp. P21]|uniref:N-acetylmuramoyl-L-alanine amidase n=1 Tax=Clostridium muellerianum TaxID=2716538 RepID=A0A7Y0EFE0_9CLOT|nr:N-acetylmuramoyl-L-alanine amidase [Clostridium muellerianum]NMM62378.1 N-acetylmuramoyl-L-alanine amidase [Clostridium muellerianum]
MIITYDFGHGIGEDRGAEGYRNEEYDCRQYGVLVIEKLQSLGHTCYDCTPSASPALSLGQSLAYRVNKANSIGSSIHLSFHVNAYETDKANGCEVEYISDSGKFYADRICSEISNALGFRNRGSQLRSGLYVLKYTNMTSILIEPFFCDTKSDCDKYDPEKLATAIVKGITGQTVSSQTQITVAAPVKIQTVSKYPETIPEGVFQVPGTKAYIEPRTDGGIGIHLDRGNYFVMKKGEISVCWNDNNGHGGSKRISG